MRAASDSTQVGVCRVCSALATSPYSMCTSCRDVAVALGRPPLPVTPIALVHGRSPLYRALRQYKSGEPEVAARQRARLTALLEGFFVRHGACVAPAGLDRCAVVPSPRGGRPPPHPLTALVSDTTALPALVDALAPGEGPVGHRRPSTGGYGVTARVEGMRLLLVDDVYTSGAHLQSAAAALLDAGARAVHAVVLGRFVRGAAPRLTCGHCGE